MTIVFFHHDTIVFFFSSGCSVDAVLYFSLFDCALAPCPNVWAPATHRTPGVVTAVAWSYMDKVTFYFYSEKPRGGVRGVL